MAHCDSFLHFLGNHFEINPGSARLPCLLYPTIQFFRGPITSRDSRYAPTACFALYGEGYVDIFMCKVIRYLENYPGVISQNFYSLFVKKVLLERVSVGQL